MSNSNKVAWVIGASSGIGAGLANRLAKRGYEVAISARRQERLEEIAHNNNRLHAFALDVSDAAGTKAVFEAVEKELGPVDLVVFGAANWQPNTVAEYDPEAFRNVFTVNFLGAVNTVAAVLPSMKARRSGEIALIASVAGYFGIPASGAYGAAKASLIHFAETAHTELEPYGIRVRLVNPGFVKTDLTAKNDFPMPFILELDDAVDRLVRGLLDTDKFEVAFPRRFVWLLKLVKLLPYPLFFAGMRRVLPSSDGKSKEGQKEKGEDGR
ncbi:SDR family NAD(P)-dependent oxidoreductase [Cucumibacter marinus]|uniref:SDR family NAD(P)-dependent oxidoreductase n=1 Tax=Cucumibacter marinus TaxID=1121252 RepID=UPI00138ADF57|nr:SDR family NAD(P)-dependent oxidoreductase [Cucumibacter marinus]